MTAPRRLFLFTIDADWIRGSEAGLEALLALSADLGLRATIFTTGKFALAYPQLLQAAHRDGHEIGTHGWQHPDPDYRFENYRLSSMGQRREWLARATEAIGGVVGERPIAFRAPLLWIDAATFGLLEEFGYTIDSSIPTRRFDGLVGVVNHFSYFWAGLEPYHPHPRDPGRKGQSAILEIPPSACLLPLNMSTVRFVGLRAASGLMKLCRGSSVLNFYCHPWEFVRPEALAFPPDSPTRHTRGTGPHLLAPLRAFLKAALARGYTSATIRQVPCAS